MKTIELIGEHLDHCVALAQGWELSDPGVPKHWQRPDSDWEFYEDWRPSTHWGQGGPIMLREGIHVAPLVAKGSAWCAVALGRVQERATGGRGVWVEGPTMLVAAMRAYVYAKIGPEVADPQ